MEPIRINAADELCKAIGIVRGPEAERAARRFVEAMTPSFSSPREAVKYMAERMGYGFLMATTETLWREKNELENEFPGSEHTVGPCAALLVPCVCRSAGAPEPCDWCCGAGRVTKRVYIIAHQMEGELESIRDDFRAGRVVSGRRIDKLLELLRASS